MTNPSDPNSNATAEANPVTVNQFHRYSDVDQSPEAQHHTLGKDLNSASPGDHVHDGTDSLLLPGYALVDHVHEFEQDPTLPDHEHAVPLWLPRGYRGSAYYEPAVEMPVLNQVYEQSLTRVSVGAATTGRRLKITLQCIFSCEATPPATFRMSMRRDMFNTETNVQTITTELNIGRLQITAAGSVGRQGMSVVYEDSVPANNIMVYSLQGARLAGGSAGDLFYGSRVLVEDMGAL